MNKKITSGIGYILTLGVLVSGVTFSTIVNAEDVVKPVTANSTTTTKAKTPISKKATTLKVAAVVNGVSVAKSVYDDMLKANIADFKSQGIDVTNADKLKKIKELTMDDLMVNEIIKQEIKKQGMEATSKDIEAKFQELVKEEGGKDKMKAKLAGLKMTEKKLRKNISDQLTNKAFFDKNVDLSTATATDQEISGFYDANVKGKKDAPELKDLSEKIKQHLVDDKKGKLIQAYIAKLKAAAKIKTNSM